MEIEDKWGKKCPPQFAVKGIVRREKRLGGRAFKNFTLQLWFISSSTTFPLIKIGESFAISLQNSKFTLQTTKTTVIESD